VPYLRGIIAGFPQRRHEFGPGRTKRQWGRFSPSTTVSPAKYSIDCSTLIIIIRRWYIRPVGGLSNSGLCSTPPPSLIKEKLKLSGLSPRANYTDRATATCRLSQCQLLRIDGVAWSAQRIPTALFSAF
jgi:hypothetical protein